MNGEKTPNQNKREILNRLIKKKGRRVKMCKVEHNKKRERFQRV